jgi:PIN domain nuclease of toxin-antitoxin system
LNGYLLDTNALLFALSIPERLSAEARAAIEAGPNMLSVISYWEVMLKSRKGKLDVGDPREWWRDAIEQLAAAQLPLRAEHIATVYTLSPHHQDPFDRVLIAQAIAEDLTLITSDAEIALYTDAGLKLIG